MAENVFHPETRWASAREAADIDLQSFVLRSAIHLLLVLPIAAILMPIAALWYAVIYGLSATLVLLGHLQSSVSYYHQVVASADGRGGYAPDVPAVVQELYRSPQDEYRLISWGSCTAAWLLRIVLVVGGFAVVHEFVPDSLLFQVVFSFFMLAVALAEKPGLRHLAGGLMIVSVLVAAGVPLHFPIVGAFVREYVPYPDEATRAGMLAMSLLAWLAWSSIVVVRTAAGEGLEYRQEDGVGLATLSGNRNGRAETPHSGIGYVWFRPINGRAYRYLHLGGMYRKAKGTRLETRKAMFEAAQPPRSADVEHISGQRVADRDEVQRAIG